LQFFHPTLSYRTDFSFRKAGAEGITATSKPPTVARGVLYHEGFCVCVVWKGRREWIVMHGSTSGRDTSARGFSFGDYVWVRLGWVGWVFCEVGLFSFFFLHGLVLFIYGVCDGWDGMGWDEMRRDGLSKQRRMGLIFTSGRASE
jgi:hypothetical protein